MNEAVRALFAGAPTLPAVVACVLEGHLGTADFASDPAAAARLTLGCYELFAGDADTDDAAALIACAAPGRELVFGNDPAWRRRIEEAYEDDVVPRPMLAFDGADLDRGRLAALAARVPDGVAVRRLDAPLAAQLDDGLAPHGLQTYASPEDLVTRGAAFGAVAGGRLVCAATSYATSREHVEVAIASREDVRGRGLAQAVAAAFLLDALAAGRVPHWSAANPASQRLARRLGMSERGVCEALVLRAG